MSLFLTCGLIGTPSQSQVLKIAPIAYGESERNTCHAAANESECNEFIPITLTGGNTIQAVDVHYEAEYESCRIEAALVAKTDGREAVIDSEVVEGSTSGVATLTLSGTTVRPDKNYGLELKVNGSKCVVHDLKVYF